MVIYMNLIHGECIAELSKLPSKSVDFVYLDLPYGQTACKWDVKLDLGDLWIQLKRIAKNDRTPFFFSCTTKFGFELIKANEKWFRWDLVWKKNRAAGFLNAYRLPMRKHEMVYCFAKKSPEYDVSSHKEYYEQTVYHKKTGVYGDKNEQVLSKVYKAPLPTSDITPPELDPNGQAEMYGIKKTGKRNQGKKDQDPLPNSDITPPSERTDNHYGLKSNKHGKTHKDPLPNSDITPSSWCEFKNDEKTGHRTAKPVALMEFLLKYWTKPDWVVLDPTMGSGSMGIACKKMGRSFIGIEMDDDIYKLAQKRVEDAIK